MLAVETLDNFTLSAVGTGLSYWKELIYVGQFQKKNTEVDMRFAVTETDIAHWVKTFNQFRERGIDVPVPKDHSMDVEDSRGLVSAMEKRTDSQGRVGLFGRIDFRDEEAAKLSVTAKVSIFVPPSYTDQHGNTYAHPIRHVALTDYPVINQLDGFIAASHITEGSLVMSIKKLAAALGVKFDDDASDDTISAAIATSFNSLKSEVKTLKAAETATTTTTADPAATKDEPGVTAGHVSTPMLSMLDENRTNKLNALVEAGKITPAVAEDLRKQYCTSEVLTLALTSETVSDGFDATIAALSKNDGMVLGEKTRGQYDRQILQPQDGQKNPLLADAERRAAAAGN